MKHRADVEQLEIGLKIPAATLQRAEEEHPAGMIEQQVILGVSDEVGDVCGPARYRGQ